MDERIIDDEYGRGIRLKKTEEGYVDVTDAAQSEEDGDEVAFAFPMEEDDEDLVSLSPEEALALRKKKEEAAAKRKADYQNACQKGEELLQNGDFAAAEKQFEEALDLDEIATLASVGYWRAKTENFVNPDVLALEYQKSDLENMEYDLGIDALDTIRTDFRPAFEKRLAELKEEEAPLQAEIETKQTRRRSVLSVRLRNAIIWFVFALVPTLAALALTAVFGFKIPTTRDNRFVLPTIICGAIAFVLFIVALFFTNKLLNAVRMFSRNERLSASDEGKRLLQIRRLKKLYNQLLAPLPDRTVKTEDEDEPETDKETDAEPETEGAGI